MPYRSATSDSPVVTNAGATGLTIWPLPAATVGKRFRCVRIDTEAGNDIRIVPDGTDKIYVHEIYNRYSFDPDDIDSGEQESYSRYVPGAAFGDTLETSFSRDLGKLFISAYISGANYVRIVLGNIDAGVAAVVVAEGIMELVIRKRARWSPGSGKYIGSHVDVDDYVELTLECFKDGEWTVTHQVGRLQYQS